MNQSYSFEFLLRMDKTDLENLSLQYDIKIKRCNAHLNMLLSNFTHVHCYYQILLMKRNLNYILINY